MNKTEMQDDQGRPLRVGEQHYRAFVGSPDKYDLVAAMQFSLLTHLGLREDHSLLDIGCGSLRAGKLFIPYLLPERYYGIEPQRWLIDEGIARECGRDQIAVKKPSFLVADDFRCTAFGRTFDYLLAHSIFTHATRAQVTTCLQQASQCMHAGSLLVATVVKGDTDYDGDEWVYPGVVTFRWDTLSAMASRHGLALHELTWPHPNQQTWIVFAKPGAADAALAASGALGVASLRREYLRCEDRLSRLQGHPLVKTGLAVRRFVLRLLRGPGE